MAESEYVIISGLDLEDNNRGTAALGYGSISYLNEKGYITNSDKLLNIRIYKNPFKKNNKNCITNIVVTNQQIIEHLLVCVSMVEYYLFNVWGLLLSFTAFGKAIRSTKLVAAINGGDGFSDIYGSTLFQRRLLESKIAMKYQIPLILLPQTYGPFELDENRIVANKILKYACKIYARDDEFVDDFIKIGVKYEQAKDLSFYMKPQPWEIDIEPNSIGINISGLAYSNQFVNLSGQFDNYPKLIRCLIQHFRDKGHTVYLIPHSYHYGEPEQNNDDMVACCHAYNCLENKSNVYFVDKNLTSPQVKYVISKMSFFIGTRMHANFAAIYTGVPVFGLAYSYKFKGAFDANGLNGDIQTAMINNIDASQINSIVDKIDRYYNSVMKNDMYDNR